MLGIIEVMLSVFYFVFDSFKLWLTNIFSAPFSNYEIFKILVPVYIGLFLAEFFQEKKGTSRGNAISNSVIVLWGGMDFFISALKDGADIFKLAIAAVIILYGFYIIVAGFMDKEIIKYIGRIREVSYFIIVFAPLYYTDTQLSFSYIFGAVVFFYIFYRALEVIDKFIPDPKALLDDMKEASKVKLLASHKRKMV
jgi:hypothetical protein